jgi:ribosome recycling factor
MVDEILADARDSMEKAVEALKRDLGKVRTGRANLGILDGVRVDYYGVPTPLNQCANLKVADPRLIVIRPYEKNMVPAVEKAIQAAEVGITPANDGEVIRLPIPPLTGERRQELAKQVRRLGEESKVAVRHNRREAIDMLKEAESEREISEDDLRRGQDLVQKATDEYTEKVDEVVGKKEKEILEG